MFGAVQGGVSGAGAAAPFMNPASHPSGPAVPRSRSNAQQYKHKQPTTPAPFRDDTRLVALRYDQTVALEPPIPLPPPRSPRRPPPRVSSLNLAAHSPVVVAPPVPPPRPPPPAEQHPALRTISTPRSFDIDRRRDSAHASTPSTRSFGSHAYTYYEADSSDEEDDPFAYEKIDTVHDIRPLQVRSNSTGSSVYSVHERERLFNLEQQREHVLRQQRESERERKREKEGEEEGEGGSERASEADTRPSDPSPSPALSTGSTSSPGLPASPTTPPPQFPKRFARTFSIRSTSSHKPSLSSSSVSSSSSSSSSSMKRLRKKSLNAVDAKGRGEGAGTVDRDRGDGNSGHPLSHLSPLSQIRQRVEHNAPIGQSNAAVAVGSGASANSHTSPSSPLSLPRSHPRRATNPIHPAPPSAHDNAVAPSNASRASPVISTTIPCESFFEEDDLSKLSFSIRGSLIFGGKRPWRSASIGSSHHKMAERDAIPEQSSHAGANTITNTKARVFPLVPATSKKDHATAPPARPPREDDMGVAALIPKPFKIPESPRLHLGPHHETVNENKLPPSIRVISAEAEKESQKVRSLYESGEALQLGDGDVPWPFGGTLEPPPEVSSDVDANDASPKSDQLPGHPTQTSASTSSLAPQGSHALAGGIEDWEGMHGHDVDRYGFIIPRRPGSGSPPTTATGSSPVRFSSRKHRNVLIRKDTASLGATPGPTKKLSARSLNTHTSELSALSRRSVRSTIRQATNKLPHNKDRRLVDEAGDLLALQPGLSYITEVEGVEKLTAELKRKEIKRTEKWRKMAKIVKPGSEGQATVFHFDAKNPKLIERTWKGIPDCWRSAAWYSFLASSAKADPINYVSDEDLRAAFHRLVEEPSPDDYQIDLDVPRTINQHIMFRRRYRGGQRLLFRVLHALSVYFPETGYVQGMAPLATTLLSYYDEEKCFIMLVRLWQFRGLNRIYQSGFVELMGALKDFETYWLNEKDVAEVLRELGIDPTAYATRWYLTLFNLAIPFPVQLRIWDVFMLLGSSPPEQPESSSGAGKEVDGYPSSKGLEILHATSLAIIDTLQATLIGSDFENAMKSLTSWVPIKDEQKFLEIVQVEWKKHQTRQKKKT